jgi:tRNA(Ile)-lysidine synthase
MHPKSGAVIRPLLSCRRDELRSWLADRRARGTPACDYVTDESNADVSIPRNRIRLELVPFLQARFNPSIVETLASEAELLRDVWTWMEEASAPLRRTPHELDVEVLGKLPVALQRLVVWQAMTAESGGRQVTADHVAAVIRLMQAGPDADGKGIDAPGQHVQRIGGRIVLQRRTGSNPVNLFRFELSIPGEAIVQAAGCRISAAEGVAGGLEATGGAMTGNGGVALIRRDLVQGSLAVRNRRPGDRFRPVGLNGSKKLQDLFVDRKLARDERDLVPLVVDETDRIVWVAGFGIDEAFRITDPSQAVLVLRLTRT